MVYYSFTARIWAIYLDMGQDSGVIRHSNRSGSFFSLPLRPKGTESGSRFLAGPDP